MADTPGALDGLVVVDLSCNLASAYTTQLFADCGAEVIQVEQPGGSALRKMSAHPFWLRGKKSIVLDLKAPDDLQVARDLVAGADVAVEAFGPNVADRLGLGYEELSSANPRLVFTSITPFGHDSPFSHLKGYEAVFMAKTGSMYGNIAPQRAGEPVMVNPLGGTMSAAFLAQQGTFIALHERETSGRGQRVDATMAQGMLAQDPWFYVVRSIIAKYPDAFSAAMAPTQASPVPTSWLSFGLLNGYSKEGKWLQFAHATPTQFDDFLRVLGLSNLKDNADSEDEDKRDELWTRMHEVVRSKSVAEWQEVFDSEKNVFAEVYISGTQIFDHPQVIHNDHVVEVEQPGLGIVREFGPLVKMSATPPDATKPVPSLDEHGSELRLRRAAPVPESTGDATVHPPLGGITIVDLGSFYAGPFGSAMLADLGARVIKIEAAAGDPIRVNMPFPESAGVRVTQGKESICIDTYTDEGVEVVKAIIKDADIVLHTYRGGVAERMGLGPEEMLELNPNLVYHHGVGYGVDGPYARRAAYAPTIAAGSGFAARSGGGGPEGLDLSIDEIKIESVSLGGVPSGHPDGMAALAVAVGMCLGLYARDRGAGGQETFTSMLSTMGHVMSDGLVEYEGWRLPPVPDEDAYGYNALYRVYPTAEGFMVLAAPSEGNWSKLAAALPGDLGTDDRFATAAARADNDDALIATLTEIFATKSAPEWEQSLSAEGVGCAHIGEAQGPLGIAMFEEGGVAEQLGLMTTTTHPVLEEVPRTRALVTLSRAEETLRPGTLNGQFTDAILTELGYDDDKIADMRSRSIIG